MERSGPTIFYAYWGCGSSQNNAAFPRLPRPVRLIYTKKPQKGPPVHMSDNKPFIGMKITFIEPLTSASFAEAQQASIIKPKTNIAQWGRGDAELPQVNPRAGRRRSR